MSIDKLHRVVGISVMLLFVATGLYMRFVVHSDTLDSATRMALRANHIYLMFSGIIHFFVGVKSLLMLSGWKRWVPILGSVLLFTSTVLLIAGFFFEYNAAELNRPLTGLGLLAVFGGGSLYFFSWWVSDRASQ